MTFLGGASRAMLPHRRILFLVGSLLFLAMLWVTHSIHEGPDSKPISILGSLPVADTPPAPPTVPAAQQGGSLGGGKGGFQRGAQGGSPRRGRSPASRFPGSAKFWPRPMAPLARACCTRAHSSCKRCCPRALKCRLQKCHRSSKVFCFASDTLFSTFHYMLQSADCESATACSRKVFHILPWSVLAAMLENA